MNNKLNIAGFTEEERRIFINFEQLYENWMSLEQKRLSDYNTSMHWKQVDNKNYLYEKNKAGIEKSKGRESEDTLKIYKIFNEEKNESESQVNEAKKSLGELIGQYRLLKLPTINSVAGQILREFDKNELLGTQYLVVGTVAFSVYALHASKKYAKEFISTLDFDLTWFDKESVKNTPSGGLLRILRGVDKTFRMNHKKPYQALNQNGYEVELLCAPSVFGKLQQKEKNFSPYPMLEQEWLRNGTPIRHIVLDTENAPTPIVAPDPRWMAVHKLWLSQKPERAPNKKPKDLAQANSLLDLLTKELFLEYPLDSDFASDLPHELSPLFDKWCQENSYLPGKTQPKMKW